MQRVTYITEQYQHNSQIWNAALSSLRFRLLKKQPAPTARFSNFYFSKLTNDILFLPPYWSRSLCICSNAQTEKRAKVLVSVSIW